MAKRSQPVRGVAQGTLARRMPDIVVPPRMNDSDTTSSLHDAIEELEKIFAEGIGKLKTAVGNDQAVVASEAQQAEQLIEGLNAKIALLETMLTETEDTLQRRDLASQETEDRLTAEIRDLQSAVKQKQEALDSRDSEVNDLKSNRDTLAEQVAQLESAIQQAKEEAASQGQQAEQVVAGLNTKINTLEAKLKETEDEFHGKALANHEKEDSLNAEIRDLKSVATQKQEALDRLDSEVNDLKSNRDTLAAQVAELESAIQQAKEETASQTQQAEQVTEELKTKFVTLETQFAQPEQVVDGADATIKGPGQDRETQVIDLDAELEPQTSGINEMYSFFTESKSLIDPQAQGIGPMVATEPLETGEERPVTSHFQSAEATSIGTESSRKFVSRDFLDRMIVDFSEFTNVIGSIAALIVRDHVRALGESMEEFPQTRLTELVESLGGEIFDYRLRTDFHERFGKG